jgi:hypothetical protein
MCTSNLGIPPSELATAGNDGAGGASHVGRVRPCSWNSSITRVRPFFRALFAADPTGRRWLPKLLSCATENQSYAAELAQMPGRLCPELLVTRSYPDDCWEHHIDLETSFESPKLPPERLLLWLINHPTVLDSAGLQATRGVEALHWRRLLLGQDRVAVQNAQVEARRRLNLSGVRGSMGQWWAFEGETVVDCFLETERMVVVFEGKRLEQLSNRTRWMAIRNQLWRSLDAAANVAAATGKRYAVMLLAEACEPVGFFEESMPHLDLENDTSFLRGHYLGCVTWLQACRSTGINYNDLPKTIEDAEP